jgi:DNA-directed RNA polymerase specialized sigma24 family protein
VEGEEPSGDLFEWAYWRYYPAVLRFLRRRTGSDMRAVELAQAVFAAASIAFRESPPPADAVPAWLQTVARRRLADLARTAATRPRGLM